MYDTQYIVIHINIHVFCSKLLKFKYDNTLMRVY